MAAADLERHRGHQYQASPKTKKVRASVDLDKSDGSKNAKPVLTPLLQKCSSDAPLLTVPSTVTVAGIGAARDEASPTSPARRKFILLKA